MKIKIYGNNEISTSLLNTVKSSLDELGLIDFIELEQTTDENLKTELGISKEPALIIEEESIDFKDVIFEGIVPEEDEIKSMLISIIGGGDSAGGCGTGGGCPSGCSC
ncbi:MAG: hypothetical protein PHH06_00115 [Candidatus Gracilibacteria bacterium]|nr:hypothetical protein [Candidatus Gracilibacteria bacterium]